MKPILLALLVSGAAVAAPLPEANISAMMAQNDAVMNKRLCAVANDRKARPGETITLVGAGGVVKVSLAAYDRMRSLGYTKNARGEWQMSANIRHYCRIDANTDECIVARFAWAQTPAKKPGKGLRTR